MSNLKKDIVLTNRLIISVCIITLLAGCGSSSDPSTDPEPALYFPPNGSSIWETSSSGSLDWNENQIDNLYEFLETNNTRAFIVLKNGKIVLEEYWGDKISGNGSFDASSLWYWASAGKTMTATLVGIAQREGLLDIDDKSSDYLGSAWTSMTKEKEDLIKIRHQLTMTTGLNYDVDDIHCTDPACLTYKTDPGSQWFYHNAPYTLLDQVVMAATGIDYNQYSDQKIESKIGMDGVWVKSGFNNTFYSTARDMARFGLLMLNEGSWNETPVLNDKTYFDEMTTPSQQLNPSYGYLWWLNGQNSIIVPSLPNSFNMPLAANAPDDMIAAMGKNGQFIDVVPSQNLVVVRMGEAPDGSLVPMVFHDEMWEKLNLVISD